jgi:hypothetical protein
MRAETQQALQRFDSQFIPFPTFDDAKNRIEENLFLFRETGVARNLVIYGEAGTGKSTLCRWMQTQYGRVKLHDRDYIQALTVSVPASATIIGMANAMLDALGDPLLVSGTASSKTHRIVKLVKGCKVELLLIDEAQHLHDRGQAKTHYYVADWLKQMIDQIGVPCVLLGLPRLEMLLRANEQLRRRFHASTKRPQSCCPELGRAQCPLIQPSWRTSLALKCAWSSSKVTFRVCFYVSQIARLLRSTRRMRPCADASPFLMSLVTLFSSIKARSLWITAPSTGVMVAPAQQLTSKRSKRTLSPQLC